MHLYMYLLTFYILQWLDLEVLMIQTNILIFFFTRGCGIGGKCFNALHKHDQITPALTFTT